MKGVLNLLKPPGMTSHDAVSVIRRLTGIRKIGHTGTLDPGAAGVLPLCIGQATRVAEYVLEMDKIYRAELHLGVATDTEDAAGKVIEEKAVPMLNFSDVEKVMAGFVGKRMQTPPMYSALRVKGKKLYEIARQGETVERQPRLVQFYQLQLLQLRGNKILFDVACSRGTYIRTLCRELAAALGTVGHMSFLLRLGVGPYTIANSLTIEECRLLQAESKLPDFLQPLDTALISLPYILISAEEAQQLKYGRWIKLTKLPEEGTLVRVYAPEQQLVAVAQIEKNYVRPRKVFT
ncbi:MAG: tRNA pseudouridine(55) synthase TruB [Firmicutes bacterium]|nr:tRNA pseudouridine(55) synthase TruB [Bacillota bacterium]